MIHNATRVSNMERTKWKSSHYKMMISPLRRKGDTPWNQIKNDCLPSLDDELIKTRQHLSFADHVKINCPALKIPSGLDISTIDLSPQSHPDWNGTDIQTKRNKNAKKNSVDDDKVDVKAIDCLTSTAL